MWPFRKKKPSHDVHEKHLEAFGLLAVISMQCIGPNRLPIKHGIREQANNVSDSGWIFSSGEEPSNPSAKDFCLTPIDRLIAVDPSLADLVDLPLGTEITRRDANEPWRFIVNNRVVDADGNPVGEVK